MKWQTYYRLGVVPQFRALEGIPQRKEGAEVGGLAQVHTQFGFGFGWRVVKDEAGYSRMKAPLHYLSIRVSYLQHHQGLHSGIRNHVRNYDRRWWHKQQCIPHDGESGICHAVDTPVYWLCTLFNWIR
jgi:hypothetical protein